MPGRIGKSGRVRSNAWTWLFSSIDKTMARSGGKKYRPTMSRTFSTNCGSADNLNVSRRCDCNPNVCQMRVGEQPAGPFARGGRCMTLPVASLLAFRLNRRVIAAAAVANEADAFRDSQYFRGPYERAEATVIE